MDQFCDQRSVFVEDNISNRSLQMELEIWTLKLDLSLHIMWTSCDLLQGAVKPPRADHMICGASECRVGQYYCPSIEQLLRTRLCSVWTTEETWISNTISTLSLLVDLQYNLYLNQQHVTSSIELDLFIPFMYRQ
jgi:hypothetical protein